MVKRVKPPGLIDLRVMLPMSDAQTTIDALRQSLPAAGFQIASVSKVYPNRYGGEARFYMKCVMEKQSAPGAQTPDADHQQTPE